MPLHWCFIGYFMPLHWCVMVCYAPILVCYIGCVMGEVPADPSPHIQGNCCFLAPHKAAYSLLWYHMVLYGMVSYGIVWFSTVNIFKLLQYATVQYLVGYGS